jgi:hypothetical protein
LRFLSAFGNVPKTLVAAFRLNIRTSRSVAACIFPALGGASKLSIAESTSKFIDTANIFVTVTVYLTLRCRKIVYQGYSHEILMAFYVCLNRKVLIPLTHIQFYLNHIFM